LEESFLMLWPKAWEILNGKFRNHSNALFFLVFLEGHISAFWDHTPVYACLRDFFFSSLFLGSGGRSQSPLCVAGGFGCLLGPFYGLP
jgi:hypothetical protein